MKFLRSFGLLVIAARLASSSLAQCEIQTLAAPSGSAGSLGSLLAQDGVRFAAATDRSVHVYEQAGRTAYLEQEIPLVLHGGYVVSLALEGNVLAVGARPYQEPDSVLVFERRPGGWVETIRLPCPVPMREDFGRSVALEGELLYVGAPSHGTPHPANSGAVYVYARSAGVWSKVETIVPAGARVYEPPGARLNEQFGYSLDVEGDRLAVGAPRAFSSRHSVYVLERTSGGWLQSVLTPAGAITGRFGVVLDLRGDVLLVGDPQASGGGRAWVFERGTSGWSETGELAQEGPDVMFGAAESVALSGDGTLALLGSPYADDPAYHAGVVHVFEKRAGVWQRAEDLRPISPGFVRSFGFALTCDGDLALVGGGGLVTTLSLDESLCRTLFAQPPTISVARGGRQTLRLNPGSEHAGRRFLLMGSATGYDPGFRVGSARIPLVPDWYFASSLPGGRRPPFVNNLGVLGAQPPQATVTIDVPRGLDLALVGLTLHHAFVVLDHGIVDVSNVRTLTLVP